MKKFILIFAFVSLAQFTMISDYSLCAWFRTGVLNGTNVSSLESAGIYIYAGTQYGVYRADLSTGTSWVHSTLTSVNVTALMASGFYLLVGTSEFGILRTNDVMGTWWQTSVTNDFIRCMAKRPNYPFDRVFAAGMTNDYRTLNDGSTWSYINEMELTYMAATNNFIFGTVAGLMRSSDDGDNWQIVHYANIANVGPVFTAGELVFLQATRVESGLLRSSDYGANFTNVFPNSGYVSCMASTGSYIFIGTAEGIYFSPNSGSSWTLKNQGFGNPLPSIYAIEIPAGYDAIYAATDDGVWCSSLSGLVGIKNISSGIPSSNKLEQNYPNPFNPSTIIKFTITENGKWKTENGIVTLKVYNITGDEIASLINEKLKPGTYEIPFSNDQFSNKRLPSGVYYYKLTTGRFSETKKMMLIK